MQTTIVPNTRPIVTAVTMGNIFGSHLDGRQNGSYDSGAVTMAVKQGVVFFLRIYCLPLQSCCATKCV